MLTVVMALSMAAWSRSQTKPPSAKQEAKKDPPTLGFAHIKDVSPITDEDAYIDELKLKKQLPGNEFVSDIRAMHEGALLNDFMESFKDSKECNGITFYLKTEKTPDFAVHIMVSGHDKPKAEQSWTWILSYLADPSPADNKSHGVGGMGIQSDAKLTARDVCLTVWDDVDPNHFKKPGGKIE